MEKLKLSYVVLFTIILKSSEIKNKIFSSIVVLVIKPNDNNILLIIIL